MSITTYLIVFSSGLVAGMFILFIANKAVSGKSDDLCGEIGRLFSMMFGAFRRTPEKNKSQGENKADLPPPVDPREQRLNDSSLAIRDMLLVLAANIQKTDKAASDSSHVLGDVKISINSMELPEDLSQARALLMKETDSVISSNAALKVELAKSQAVLSEQQSQIENLRTEIVDLHTAVRIDGLTQVANRAYFDEKLMEVLSVHKRYGDPFALMMIDIDHFKTANDTYGHQAGDRILKGVAMKLKASIRGSDLLARFGGDEFAIILLKSEIAAATDVAWKLNKEVQASRFILDDVSLSVTLSIGVAEVHADDTGETLLKRADAALYRTKTGGRNGVSVDGA